jgi:hypothetical protein
MSDSHHINKYHCPLQRIAAVLNLAIERLDTAYLSFIKSLNLSYVALSSNLETQHPSTLLFASPFTCSQIHANSYMKSALRIAYESSRALPSDASFE